MQVSFIFKALIAMVKLKSLIISPYGEMAITRDFLSRVLGSNPSTGTKVFEVRKAANTPEMVLKEM